MPVVMNGPGPTVNYIGMSPEERAKQLRDQRAREHSFQRITPSTVKLISPDGVEETVLQDNMRDYVRLKGYKLAEQKPKAKVKTDAPDDAQEDETVLDDAVKIAVARENEIETAVSDIEALRTELKELGVEFDQRWGRRRLLAELTEARAKKAE